MNKEQVKKVLDERLQSKKLSCWKKGVVYYAFDLLENIDENELLKDFTKLEKLLLNGASNWSDYSWNGYSLCYDWQICERLATPTEQKRTKHGFLRPNKNEEWLDVQRRALFQACDLIHDIVNR